MKNLILLVAVTLISGNVFAVPYEGPRLPKNTARWDQFCSEKSGEMPIAPKYSAKLVKDAAAVLNKVDPMSFYFYSGPLKAYGLKKKYTGTPDGAPGGTISHTHNFLTILCGEFRDRPTMIEAKLNWVINLKKLPTTAQKNIKYDEPIWGQVSAHSYKPYLDFSLRLYNERRLTIGRVDVTSSLNLERPVPAQTVCETKFIFGEFIARNKDFEDLESYEKDLEAFSKKNCDKEDLSYYYEFRGDSNFKPNSPEANGMIWYSTSVTNNCQTTKTAKPNNEAGITNKNCADYFKAPFMSRWNAARSGMASILFHAKTQTQFFSVPQYSISILPKVNSFKGPFPYRILDEEKDDFISTWHSALSENWAKPDIGFNDLTGLGGKRPKYDLAYERIKIFVDRHSDWYASGYDDGMGVVKTEAYSPFVASSYEMTASDEFTHPGATIDSPSDGRKHWMFVFKVKKTNWYNSERLKSNDPVDFDEMWFDETTFGTSAYAIKERAWDRLGSPLEEEYDSIIYLHNITTEGEVKRD